jgi:tryptophanyl-tRNA synthetase
MRGLSFDESYCQDLMLQGTCGSYPFEKFNFEFGLMSKQELQRLWIYHVNGSSFKEALDHGKPVIATTGFGLTGPPHVGTVAQILKAICLQKKGIPVQIVLGDLDAYNGKAANFSAVLKLVPRYKEFIRSLGFDDSPPSILRTQFEALPVLRTLYMTGNYLSDEMFEAAKEDVHDFYSKHNKVDRAMTYRIKLSLNLMVADFLDLHVQQGFASVAVFLGIDEYKYCGLAMDVLARIKSQESSFDGFSLAGMFSSVLKGFYGYPKMGKSFPDSGIGVEMSLPEIEDRLIYGEESYCSAEDSLVYQMMLLVSTYTSEQILNAYCACKEGGMKWINLKKEYARHLHDIFSLWKNI